MALDQGGLVGKEMGGADDTLDNLYDPETNPNKDMPLDELERLIDGGEPPPPAPKAKSKASEETTEEAETEEAAEETPKEGGEEQTEGEETGEEAVEAEKPKGPSLEQRLAAFEEREEKRELELERLRLHNSRLAAKLGNTERKLTERQRRETTGEVDEDGLADIREEIASLKADRHAEALDSAVRDEFVRFGARPDVKELAPMLQKLAPSFGKRYEELAAIQDVTEARLAARELQLDMLAEARAEQSKTDRAEAERRKLDASAKLTKDKKKASVTESSVRGAAAKSKAFDPETAPLDELEAVIDREAGVQR